MKFSDNSGGDGMMKVCGIDEAGKGPVIGDLVIVGCLINEDDMGLMNEMGVKDSKLLTPTKRSELFPKIKETVESHHVVRVSAEEIDSRNKVGCNLNTLECIKMAQVINELEPDKVIIDCPHPRTKHFKNMLKPYLNNPNIIIISEHKADYNYSLVGAASIIAKVVRDSHIKELEKNLNLIIGSGYPNDPLTKKLLNDYFEKNYTELKPYIRHSWSTYKLKKSRREQKGLLDYDK